MYETFPKNGANPSFPVGEQKKEMAAGNGTSYPKKGAGASAYNGDRSKTKSNSGGSGSPNKNEYPKSATKFGTEKSGVL